ncbi:hypothetical protein [Hasllibacter sp. MH4015]|uniref:hypothetical protein n=1 Tax=Hasllibacter sp. MH4015 TaxID=2854029 RepID=UPI001CD7F3FB|nr:hypothetical protein [Hasllibacter sp. MH4015]
MPDKDKIEAELSRDRAELRARLETLGQRLASDAIVSQVVSSIGRGGGDATRQIGEVARNNKAPLSIAALGLGWLAANVLKGSSEPAPRPAFDRTSTPTATGFRDPSETHMTFDERVAAADAALRADTPNSIMEGDFPMTDHTTNSTLKDRAYGTAESLRARLEDGLGDLPEAARARVRQAREMAIAAQAEVESNARAAARTARNAAYDNPLLIGALALAAGAALGAALPRTSVENRTIGGHRDRLFDDADRILRDELAKARASAEDMIAEGQDRVKEAISDGADKVSKKVEDATGAPKAA